MSLAVTISNTKSKVTVSIDSHIGISFNVSAEFKMSLKHDDQLVVVGHIFKKQLRQCAFLFEPGLKDSTILWLLIFYFFRIIEMTSCLSCSNSILIFCRPSRDLGNVTAAWICLVVLK